MTIWYWFVFCLSRGLFMPINRRPDLIVLFDQWFVSNNPYTLISPLKRYVSMEESIEARFLLNYLLSLYFGTPVESLVINKSFRDFLIDKKNNLPQNYSTKNKCFNDIFKIFKDVFKTSALGWFLDSLGRHFLDTFWPKKKLSESIGSNFPGCIVG